MKTILRWSGYSILLAIAAVSVAATSPIARCQTASLTDEAKLIELLRSDAPAAEKALACKRLAVYGSEVCVPELARLLSDEQLSSWARIALEAIPGSSADDALREAVASLHGKLQVGAINSIGVRRDAKSVEMLSARLRGDDPEVRIAAAAALGRIGNAETAKVLRSELVAEPAEVRSAVAEGCVLCAERFLSEGNSAAAIEIFDAVRGVAALPQQRVMEATRGAILARGKDGIPLWLEQFRSSDNRCFQLALSAAREIEGSEIDKAMAEELGRTAPDRAIALIQAMADRNKTVIVSALVKAAASGNDGVRISALEAIGRVGDSTCISTLLEIGLESKAAIAQAAKSALAQLPGESVGQEILVHLPKATGDRYVLLLEIVGERRIEAVDELVAALNHADQAVRRAALTSLGNTVSGDRLPVLVAAVSSPKNPDEQPVALQALKTAAVRMPDREACATLLANALTDASQATKISLLEILSAVGGTKALGTVSAAAKSSDARLQDVGSRLLGEWMTIDAAPVLLDLAKTAPGDKYRVRAMRGYIRIARQFAMPDEERILMCQKAFDSCWQLAEQKLVLDLVKRYPSPQTFEIAVKARSIPELKDDATMAILAMASSLENPSAKLREILSKDGLAKVKLEVVKAEYGSGSKQVDVTETVRKQVAEDQLIVLPTAAYNEAFGGDPVPGSPKELKISYRIDGKPGEAVFVENAIILLPLPK